jgi:hypothetical protein
MAFSKLTHMWDKVKEDAEVFAIIVRNDSYKLVQILDGRFQPSKLQLSLEQKGKVVNWLIVKGDPHSLNFLLYHDAFLLSPKQKQEVANKIIVEGDILELLRLLEVEEYQLSPEQKQKVENRIMVEIDKRRENYGPGALGSVVYPLLRHLLSIQLSTAQLNTEQYTKVVNRVIEITDSDSILEMLELETTRPLNTEQSNTIFLFFGQFIPRLSIENLRAIVKMASRRQVLSFSNKYSNQLDEPRSDIVEKRLSVVESLIQLCCERLQQPDISQKMRDEFNARMKLEGAFHSLIHPKVDV